jgi:site-specific DNA-methyltransferase (adenine-specific)
MKLAYEDEFVTLYCGDGREMMTPEWMPAAIVTDPPYGETSLSWDRTVSGWVNLAADMTTQLWCFGSMRFFLRHAPEFQAAGWKYGQEIVWEKHNGSGFHADRFKRVHEFAVQWYLGDWSNLHRDVPVTADARKRTVRRKGRPAHTGHIDNPPYTSEDGGPRLMRSVLQVRSEHGRAIHPTQKPTGILRPLIQYSAPAGFTIFDPFAGSGSTLIAARECGRRAIGCEINPDYCEAAARRLAQQELLVA